MGQMTKLDIEYALLAGRAYQDRRTVDNRIAKPAGWSQLTPEEGLGHTRSPTSGFETVAFRNDATGEIVISFAGTDFSEKPDLIADGLLGLGLVNQQLIDAAIFYKKVQQACGNNITFTGHSLGGGLAAVMGVFFDRPAVTFDPAPFRLLAIKSSVQPAASALRDAGFADDAMLKAYETSKRSPVARPVRLVATRTWASSRSASASSSSSPRTRSRSTACSKAKSSSSEPMRRSLRRRRERPAHRT
jgi:hypothetical protein